MNNNQNTVVICPDDTDDSCRTVFGLHFMVEGYGVDTEKLDDMKLVFRFLNELPEVIDMKKLTAPMVVNAEETATGKDPGGISGFVLINESHISIHTFPKRGFFTMDVYSCRNFEDRLNTLLSYVRQIFPYEKEELHLVKRGLEYPTENV